MGTLDNYPDQLIRFEVTNRGVVYRFVVQASAILLFQGYTLLATWNKTS